MTKKDTLPSTVDIVEKLHHHFLTAQHRGSPPWTMSVAKVLKKLAPRGEVVVYGRQFSRRPEYLCDQVWGWEASDDWESYRGLALVMECEWNTNKDARLIDFCKVLDVCADRRIFVGQARTRHFKSVVGDEMVPMMKSHKFIGDADVGVVLAEVGGEERVDAWIISKSGANLVLEG